MQTGKREWNCEISIIDTAIFICGVITAGEYFGKEVKNKADILYKKINWKWYRNKTNNLFYMGYPIDKSMYYEFNKKKKDYKDIKDIIYTYCGTLFTYQYSHAWIDFKNLTDINGVNWFENSIKATKANREYCIDNKDKFKTYGENSWGLTSCLSPKGYIGSGAEPCDTNLEIENDGTISPCGAIGSIVFTPKESIQAMEYYYNTFRKLWGKYGFKDGFNLEGKKGWFASEYIGIDKGIEMLMIENYLNETIWKYFMKNEYVIKGLKILEFTDNKSENLKLNKV